MKTKYTLEIYEPDDARCVAGSYDSDTPFGSITKGDIINASSLNMATDRRTLVVTSVEHILWEIEDSHRTQKICVRTKLYEPSDS